LQLSVGIGRESVCFDQHFLQYTFTPSLVTPATCRFQQMIHHAEAGAAKTAARKIDIISILHIRMS
jgi:hypothetical protein